MRHSIDAIACLQQHPFILLNASDNKDTRSRTQRLEFLSEFGDVSVTLFSGDSYSKRKVVISLSLTLLFLICLFPLPPLTLFPSKTLDYVLWTG